MSINPRLAHLLETYEPERLKAILMWFNADAQSAPFQSQRLNAILEEVETASIETCYHWAAQLNTDELVRLSILNEFGPPFEARPAFQWLNRVLCRRFIEESAANAEAET